MPDNWIFFKEIDFSDKEITYISIDTRDFHCLVVKESINYGWSAEKLNELKSNFFYSDEEAKEIIDWLFTESGGNKKWRHLILEGRGSKVSQGWLKYIRLQKTESGWIFLNRDSSLAISKGVFAESTINKEYLNAH